MAFNLSRALITILLPLFALTACTTASLQVDLGYAIYKGYNNETAGLNIWKGIRFASAPIGQLRWQPPQTPATNRTVVQATDFGPFCPQNYPSIPNAPFIPGDEDCLFLNVYAPSNASNLPVLVWIHGGGYGFGDGTQDMSTIINANDGSFVAVTVQYRLGAFGFISSSEVHGKGVVNAGLLDQAFAFAWIQKHISLFGGDATRVTISGESAGGGSVMLHAMANGGNGTRQFTNLIAASPYLPAQYMYDDTTPTAHYYEFAAKAGCGSEGEVFECLLAADTLTLQAASSNVSTSQSYGTWAFLPVIDGQYVQQLPSRQLPQHLVNGMRILVGNNANEGALFVPYNITTLTDLTAWIHTAFPNLSDYNVTQVLAAYPSTSAPVNASDPKYATDGYGPDTAVNISQAATGQQQRANNIYAEATFVCPSYWLASAFTANSRVAYKYQYSVPFASHQDDIPSYFGPATPSQGPDFVLAFRKIWGNFITQNNPSISGQLANGASSSHPNASNPASAWPTWSESSPQHINLNETGGTPYTAVTTFGVSVTQFMEPGLENDITVADAYVWEGGRGARCDFWRAMGPTVPI
ncbi:alpha/beta-hydrolase [Zopfia rhizophila CBS 207.26]|uniref:Carboxylic ester hydrolase n=1 Tax=Zopfia rhizophila CBS 207.26 TaxID=1314779 RepID=A0A6A6E0K9_9PEZI|nr:alpha/beta-hydrolase [Zopfia rhizophila CBS 207.26]